MEIKTGFAGGKENDSRNPDSILLIFISVKIIVRWN
jgi:hypothetical protein